MGNQKEELALSQIPMMLAPENSPLGKKCSETQALSNWHFEQWSISGPTKLPKTGLNKGASQANTSRITHVGTKWESMISGV